MSYADAATLTVKIDGTTYGIPIGEIAEAATLDKWTPIPSPRNGYVGAVACHDWVVALLDYEQRLTAERPFIVFLKNDKYFFGLLVDEIGAVAGIERAEPPPELKPLFEQLDKILQFPPMEGEIEERISDEAPKHIHIEILNIERILVKLSPLAKTSDILSKVPPKI
ncbi:MAG: hypothetical protein Kow0090_00950 [Myxococcota bacterium]